MTTIILVWIVTLSTGGGINSREYVMPDWETCFAAVEAAKIEVAKSGDAESTVSIFCATSNGIETTSDGIERNEE